MPDLVGPICLLIIILQHVFDAHHVTCVGLLFDFVFEVKEIFLGDRVVESLVQPIDGFFVLAEALLQLLYLILVLLDLLLAVVANLLEVHGARQFCFSILKFLPRMKLHSHLTNLRVEFCGHYVGAKSVQHIRLAVLVQSHKLADLVHCLIELLDRALYFAQVDRGVWQ